MSYYPLFLDLADQNVLVAGAGEVGLRKASAVLKAKPARLDLIDPFLDEQAVRIQLPSEDLYLHRRPFEAADLHGKSLVFAATGKREVNALIASLCREKKLLCNIADAPAEGNFIVPALVDTGGLTIALSTGGQSPALARFLRRDLEAWVEKRYIPLLVLLGRLRPMLLELGLPTGENSALFRNIVASPLPDLLHNRDYATAGELLTGILPEPLHRRMGELIDGF